MTEEQGTVPEWEVLDLLTRHHTTRQIANALYVEEVTVRTHIAAILRKLQVPNRQRAIELVSPRDIAPHLMRRKARLPQ